MGLVLDPGGVFVGEISADLLPVSFARWLGSYEKYSGVARKSMIRKVNFLIMKLLWKDQSHHSSPSAVQGKVGLSFRKAAQKVP